MNVHQVLSGAGPFDAITTEALVFRTYFRSWGWGGGDFAARIAPRIDGEILALWKLAPVPGDVLLFHHSASWPRLEQLLALPNPKLLLYHNVTPASWLWDHAPLVAVHCAIGREQLPVLVAAADVAAADSEFNAAELLALGAEETRVIPLLLDLDRLGGLLERDRRSADSPVVLFVGRLSPHKRQDEVIRAFSLYRRYRAPAAKLMLVGDPITAGYAQSLRELADALAPGAVSIESSLSAEDLACRYLGADVFLCLSEHEGFCIPIVEAFRFGVPVVAKAVGAVPEIAGDAALLLDDPDLALVAELLHMAVTDEPLRAELQRRAGRRLDALSPQLIAARLREAVEATAAARSSQ